MLLNFKKSSFNACVNLLQHLAGTKVEDPSQELFITGHNNQLYLLNHGFTSHQQHFISYLLGSYDGSHDICFSISLTQAKLFLKQCATLGKVEDIVCKVLPKTHAFELQNDTNAGAKYKIPFRHYSELPEEMAIDMIEMNQPVFTLQSFQLNYLHEALSFCTESQRSENRPYLNGYAFCNKDNFLSTSATNGILIGTCDFPEVPYTSENMLIPSKAIDALVSYNSSKLSDVYTFYAAQKVCIVKTNQFLLHFSLFESEIPDYQEVLNQFEVKNETIIDGDEFLKRLQNVAVMCDDKVKHVTLTKEPNSSLLTVFTQNVNYGDARDKIKLDTQTNPESDIQSGFNIYKLLDIAKFLEDSQISAFLPAGTNPCYFKITAPQPVLYVLAQLLKT